MKNYKKLKKIKIKYIMKNKLQQKNRKIGFLKFYKKWLKIKLIKRQFLCLLKLECFLKLRFLKYKKEKRI